MAIFVSMAGQRPEEKTIPAVMQEDLMALLQAMKKLDDLHQGRIFCSNCGNLITLENLQMILPKGDNRYDWLCNNLKCLESAVEKPTH